ncbi:Meckelin [Allomyces javanicus]|nr:Meckelin [Allomyces javanicus]
MTATWSGTAYSCQCSSGYAANADGTACTATSFVTTVQTAYASYSSVSLTSSGQVVQQTVSSAYLTARFIPDLYACTQLGSPAACQRIANHCALVYGDPKQPICLAYGAYKTTAMPMLLVPLIQDPGATPIDGPVASVAVIVYTANGTVAETLDWAAWVARMGKVPTAFTLTVGRSQTVACAAGAAAAAFPAHLFELVAKTVHGTRVPIWARVAAGQYVRRFFLWDALVLDGAGSRAATHVTLTMSMSASGGYLAPVVTVTHAESLTLAPTPLTIATEYAMDTSRVWAGLNITFPLVVLSLVFLWTVRLSSRTRRNRRGTQFVLDAAWAVKYVTVLTGMVGPFLFWCAMAAAWYFYVFVMYQTTNYVWLPPKSDYTVIVWMLAVAMVVQAAYVAGAVWEQAAATVLLVDWEPGQGKGGGVASAVGVANGVSAWRRLHVAKKWSEISVYRRVWTVMTLLITVAAVPAQGDVLLQTAEDALVFGGLAIAQYATMTLLVERFYHSAPMNFVDLLSLANVSILTMRHDELDGFYLHGKSVFPYADTDMATLVAQMHRETSDAVTRRGLLARDDVLFAAWWAPAFRAVYESIVAMSGSATPGNGVWMEPKVGGAGRRGSARAGRARAAPVVVDSRAPPERAQWEAVNALATRLLDQNLKDQRYQLIQRTVVAKWLGQIPDADMATSLLSPESGPAFLGMMWAGIELNVLMLVLLVYLVTAWASGGQRVVAALVAILVETALRRARKWYGMRTVAQTAYLDLRFMG